jgi:hypothetical protein
VRGEAERSAHAELERGRELRAAFRNMIGDDARALTALYASNATDEEKRPARRRLRALRARTKRRRRRPAAASRSTAGSPAAQQRRHRRDGAVRRPGAPVHGAAGAENGDSRASTRGSRRWGAAAGERSGALARCAVALRAGAPRAVCTPSRLFCGQKPLESSIPLPHPVADPGEAARRCDLANLGDVATAPP